MSNPAPHLAIFGERIIGSEAAKYFENPQSKQATVFGSRVVGATAPPAGEEAGVSGAGGTGDDENGNGIISIAELKDALQADPGRLDEFIAAEAGRTPPRKGAVRLFRDTEAAKPEAEQRVQVISDLDQLLAALSAG